MKGTPCRPALTAAVCSDSQRWWEFRETELVGLEGHRRGKDGNLPLWQQGMKCKFLGSRVTSKETQENASQELLGVKSKGDI